MDSLDQVKKLREDYERALDAAESRRVAYHEAVLDLYRSGTPLREIASELGLSHQRVHQIVSGEPQRHKKLPRAAGGAGAALVLIAATFGALRIAHAPPFVETVRVPAVINLRDGFAVPRIVQNGLNARVIWRRKHIGIGLIQHVYAESPAPGERVAKGSTVTLYEEIPAKHFHCAGPNNTPCPTTYFYRALPSSGAAATRPAAADAQVAAATNGTPVVIDPKTGAVLRLGALKLRPAKSGRFVVIDPKTGAVLRIR